MTAPGGIRDTGARVVTYGAPVLPGAMLLIAYYEKEGKCIPILGLPGCVMYAKRTVFDLVLPRIMADDEIFPEEVAAYGEGGAFQYTNEFHENILGFCNNIFNAEGGTHITGFKTVFTTCLLYTSRCV